MEQVTKSPKATIVWVPGNNHALIPGGEVRADWWNFLPEKSAGTNIPATAIISSKEQIALLISGKIKDLADFTQAREGIYDNQTLRELLALDDSMTGGIFGRELARRKLKSAELTPISMSLNISRVHTTSPKARFKDKVTQIMEATPLQAGNLVNIYNQEESQKKITLLEKNQIWEKLTKSFCQKNVDKILRIGEQLATPEQLAAIRTNEHFIQKLFERRFHAGRNIPENEVTREIAGIYAKRRFLESKKPIKWTQTQDGRIGYKTEQIPWEYLLWISDKDAPIEKLIPSVKDNFLGKTIPRIYPGVFPDLQTLVKISNRMVDIVDTTGDPQRNNVLRISLDCISSYFGKENAIQMYNLHLEDLCPEAQNLLTEKYAKGV